MCSLINRYSYCSLGIHLDEEVRRVISMIVLHDDRKMGEEIVRVSCHSYLCDLVALGDIMKGKAMWLILSTIA